MSREEFVKELEYLLSDIQEEEKADALQYYRDYFEEAGEENEQAIISDFGSPERIAAIIRSDMAGNLEDGGEFTDKGYRDERFRDPNYQMAKRYDLPDVNEEPKREYDYDSKKKKAGKEQVYTSKTLKIVLLVILVLLASPLLLGVGGGIVGILAGLAGILIALVAVIGALTAAFLLAGVATFVAGIITLLASPLNGMLLLGIGIFFIGLGLLFLVIAILFYGRFIPYLFRTAVNCINTVFHKTRRQNA